MSNAPPEPFEKVEGAENRGSNQSGMRARNERLVLTILRQNGALPKAEIARRTGLSAQTVSVIMRALEKDGLLEKGEKVRGKVGQPSVPLGLAPEGAYFFGLKVGRRSAELMLVNFVGGIRSRRRLTYPYPTPAKTLEFVRQAAADIANELTKAQRARISGMGIAMPFFLWEWAGIVGVDGNEMAAWRDFDLSTELGAMFDFPVYLGNDATCACGAELVFGTADKPRDYLYIYVGFFIGGGVVLNGNLFTGSSGNAGAIGPFPATGAHGEPRQLVDVASLIGLERRLVEAGGPAGELWEDPESWSVDQSVVADWLDEAVPAISHMILASISIIDFSAIILDGSVPSWLRETISNRVRDHLRQLNLSGLKEPRIIAGSIGGDARPLGAASLALSKRFFLEA